MKNNSGFTIIECLIVLTVSAMSLTAGLSYYNNYLNGIQAQVVSDQTKQVAEASKKYIKDNFTAIAALAGPTTPAVITVPMLVATNYLPAGFSATNSYGQTYQILAREPVANKLDTLIVTTGGQAIPELNLRRISQLIGSNGGFISSSDTTVVQGSFGGWQESLANFGVAPGAGRYGASLFFEDGHVVGDYLYRNSVPGKPELNRMNANLDMNAMNVSNIGNITATTGTITTANSTTINTETLNSGNINNTGTTTTSLSTLTGGSFISINDGGWFNSKWSGGFQMIDSQWIRAYNDKGILTGGVVQAGSLVSNGRVTSGEFIEIKGIAGPGAACATNGTVARDADGTLVSCVSGVWKASGAMKIGAPTDILVGTIYQAPSDGLLLTIPYDGAGGSYHYVMAGPSSPPTLVISHGKAYGEYGTLSTTTTPILKGYYFRVVNYYGQNPVSIRFFPFN